MRKIGAGRVKLVAEFLLYLPSRRYRCAERSRVQAKFSCVSCRQIPSKVLRRANASVDVDETTDHVAPFAAIGLLAQMLPMPRLLKLGTWACRLVCLRDLEC